MTVLFAVSGLHYLFSIPLAVICVFLILLILVQRGRGGGLTGALGGMGGQSAFGTKAGDVFTRITIIVAAVWILTSMAAIKVLTAKATAGPLDPNQRNVAPVAPGKAGDKAEAEDVDTSGRPAAEKAERGPEKSAAEEPPPTAGPSLPPAPEKAAEKSSESSGDAKTDDEK